MQCKYEELISRFIDNDLDSRETVELQNHLSLCKSCKVFLHETQESEKSFREVLNSAIPSGGLSEKVMLKIGREIPNYYPLQTPASSVSVSFAKFLVPAFAVILGLVLSFNFMHFKTWKTDPISVQEPAAISAHHSPGTVTGFPLEDKSSVDNRILPMGSNFFVDTRKIQEFKGLISFKLDEKGNNQITWNGTGKFAIDSGNIDWKCGLGEFNFYLSKPVEMKVQNVVFTISGTRIKISGKTGAPVRMTLLQGKVSFLTSYGMRKFVDEGSTVLVTNKSVDLVVPIMGGREEISSLPNTTPVKPGGFGGHAKNPDNETDSKAKVISNNVPSPFDPQPSKESAPADSR